MILLQHYYNKKEFQEQYLFLMRHILLLDLGQQVKKLLASVLGLEINAIMNLLYGELLHWMKLEKELKDFYLIF